MGALRQTKPFSRLVLVQVRDARYQGDRILIGKNLLVLPESQPHYEDLVRAADVVVSKPGYGIVADVISHQVPILYTSRGHFPEYPILVEALNQWATSEFIPQEVLLTGELGPYLKRLLEKEQNWPAVNLNGAQVAAEKTLDLLKQHG